jgi:hypothetical protein
VSLAEVDPSWLLSTTAQSAAAIVAIVGGFLVSRLVSLVGEREGLLGRKQEIEARLTVLRDDLDAVTDDTLAVARDWFREEWLAKYVERRGEPFEVPVYEGEIFIGSEPENYQPWGDELAAQVRDAFARVEEAMPRPRISATVDELRELGVDVDGMGEDLVGLVAEHIADERRPPGVQVAPKSRHIDITGDIRSEFTQLRIAEQKRRVERRDVLRSDVRSREAEIAIVESWLLNFREPEGIRLAFGVLTYFALVGVVLPLVLLAQRPVPRGPWSRGGIVAFFVTGLGAVLVTMWSAVKRLRVEPRAEPES